MQYSFDIVGDVAVFETRERGNDRKIAGEIISRHKSVRSVFRKTGERKGRYRLRKLKRITGKGGKTVHREHGYLLSMDLEKVYFSSRESTERQRIAEQARPGEKVLVMFSGVEPYSIAIAKKKPEIGKIYGVEINPAAEEFALENIRVNKLSHKIVHITGDVRKVPLPGKFDRVVMPLPEGGKDFLNVAFRECRKGGTIHFYSISGEEDFRDAENHLKGYRYKLLSRRKVLPYSPGRWKVCLEIRKL